ncbi:cell division protein FtsQ/DivIB [Alteribacillus bidgolensis]|uniref:Cell division protein DivIB n=1 Tax=Alteribacillus bidgolensis TaxID=930129 RepID=A0A1G8G9U8_9BACI|nr:FtsQ-type POTRA domain-containing protein [Alteribacillus bidgolensis]SDH91080.1 cell division protein FtsQ [Alteribacillus bidgolensis]
MPDKKVVTIDDRIPALKEKRKKRSNRRLIIYLSIFFILILMVIYFQSPLSHVRNIQVDGNVHVDKEEIINASEIQEGISIWNIDTGKTAAKLKEFTEVEDAAVSRSFPSTIQIDIDEYKRMAYVETGDQYIPILKNGEVLHDNTTSVLPADAPVLQNFEEERLLKAFAQELSQLGEGILNRISEVSYVQEEDSGSLVLYMNDGIEVATTIHNFASYMSSYPSVAREISPNTPGVLHMKMSPYFESTEEETDETEESEGIEETEAESAGEEENVEEE